VQRRQPGTRFSPRGERLANAEQGFFESRLRSSRILGAAPKRGIRKPL
jgi:hypothetical protein